MEAKTEHRFSAPHTWAPLDLVADVIRADRNLVEQKHPVVGFHQYLRNHYYPHGGASLVVERETKAPTTSQSKGAK